MTRSFKSTRPASAPTRRGSSAALKKTERAALYGPCFGRSPSTVCGAVRLLKDGGRLRVRAVDVGAASEAHMARHDPVRITPAIEAAEVHEVLPSRRQERCLPRAYRVPPACLRLAPGVPTACLS
jgi:hypothetical protein